jgi:hypothetical protein
MAALRETIGKSAARLPDNQHAAAFCKLEASSTPRIYRAFRR